MSVVLRFPADSASVELDQWALSSGTQQTMSLLKLDHWPQVPRRQYLCWILIHDCCPQVPSRQYPCWNLTIVLRYPEDRTSIEPDHCPQVPSRLYLWTLPLSTGTQETVPQLTFEQTVPCWDLTNERCPLLNLTSERCPLLNLTNERCPQVPSRRWWCVWRATPVSWWWPRTATSTPDRHPRLWSVTLNPARPGQFLRRWTWVCLSLENWCTYNCGTKSRLFGQEQE